MRADSGTSIRLPIPSVVGVAASLLYGVLGRVSVAGLDLGPLRMSGRAAVLLGRAFLFNQGLDLLEEIRQEKRVEQFGLDFDEHVARSDGWFAVCESTGVPVEVAVTTPLRTRSLRRWRGRSLLACRSSWPPKMEMTATFYFRDVKLRSEWIKKPWHERSLMQ